MKPLTQPPTDPEFVQDPYSFYDRARAQGPLVYWQDYKMPAAMGYEAVTALMKDRRFGREKPGGQSVPPHLQDFDAIETHSMLERDGDTHKRLRGLVLRAFTSRRIAGLAPEIEALCDRLIEGFPKGPFDLLETYATQLPVIIIARLLGVDETSAPALLRWSHAMVAMYQANRTRETEVSANRAARDFGAFIRDQIAVRRGTPGDDLITHLIAAEEDGQKLTTNELISTCILLLNAGHEATVHTLGNAVKCLLEHKTDTDPHPTDITDTALEELLRYDPPLHMFTRFAQEPCTVFGHRFNTGDEVALMLAAANRDPDRWTDPNRFEPTRAIKTHTSFGAGAHFCVGAPLARLELQIGLARLFQRCPRLRQAEETLYANSYHFHGLTRLMVEI